MRVTLALLLLAGVAAAVVHRQPSGALTGTTLSPIQKVVTLLTEMKAQTSKEGEEDLAAYDKYKCWCETSEAEKNEAVKAAEAKLQELGAFVEEAAAKEGQLKTEIAALADDIAADKDSLASATSMRAKENAEFAIEEADTKETLGLLAEATTVLSKVQLMQKQHKGQGAEVKQALLQVRDIVSHISPKFGSVMQKDLFDMLGEFQTLHQTKLATSSFLGTSLFGPINAGTGGLGVKSDEQLGKEAKPNSEAGAAAGSKSYNSRSGGILGLLNEMQDNFKRQLAASQKEELQSLVDFQKLSAAKTSEIMAATHQKQNKEIELADLLDKVAKAKEDIEATQATLTEDEAFLVQMTGNCKTEDEEYAKRNTVRTDEIKALSETLNILTGDEARSLFDKTISFLQVGSVSHNAVAQAAAQEVARTQAMKKILAVSRKHKNWMLATLAVSVKLDAFTKVIAAMDKMRAELQEQQKAEYAKHDSCKKDIDMTEDKIWTGKNEKSDLADKHKDQSNTIQVLTTNIEELSSEVAAAEVSLKEAGEQRKAGNALFQTSIADQRATAQILRMALGRLKEFYTPAGASMAQVNLHVQASQSVAPPPPKPRAYEKSASSGGVLQLLAMIIADAGRTEDALKMSEQKAQKDYAGYVAATTASIEADRLAISESQKQLAGTNGEQAETAEAQLANGQSLDKLNELLGGIHSECDYLLKYFDIRQQSRAEEMDAIKDAKAILSGADFA